jgi:NADPH:quinone reductase-like Zn-dependent oxidoreductase
MKAMRIHGYGGPDVLQCDELIRPVPAAGEVLVRVMAAGVNPVDWKIRYGYVRSLIDPPLPVALGGEIAGIVEAKGAGVDGFALGTAVFGLIGLWGGYAEYVAVPASVLAHKPDTLSFAQAGSVPLPALTAWQALLDIAKLQPGQRVLIHAAAGGVGSYAVQIAKMNGAYVIGTSSAANMERLRALGVDQALDYTSVAFEKEVGEVDIVLDLVGGDVLDRSWSVLKPAGLLISAVMPPDQTAADAAGVRSTFVAVHPDGKCLQEIGRLIECGAISVGSSPIVFPMEDAVSAQQLSETGHAPARIVLKIS